MNIHLFYLKPSDDYNSDIPSLYAYTNDKNLAEEFIDDRNMNRFIYKKSWIDKEEFRKFDSMHSRLHLSRGSFSTVSEINGRSMNVSFVCTWGEEESILKNSDKLWSEYSNILFDTRVFEDKYLIALEKLLFMKFYGFYGSLRFNDGIDYFYEPYYTSYGPIKSFISEEFHYNVKYDELALFLRFHKDLFKAEPKNKDK